MRIPITNEALAQQYRETYTQEGDPLFGLYRVLSIQHVNHRPHPFMVGSKAVSIAADKYSGLLSEAAMEEAGCDWREGNNPGRGYGPRCGLGPNAHTSDRVLVLQLQRHATTTEARAALQPLGAPMLADGIDGIAFVETPEQYRVTDPTKNQETPP